MSEHDSTLGEEEIQSEAPSDTPAETDTDGTDGDSDGMDSGGGGSDSDGTDSDSDDTDA
jgi:hypothetical protein